MFLFTVFLREAATLFWLSGECGCGVCLCIARSSPFPFARSVSPGAPCEPTWVRYFVGRDAGPYIIYKYISYLPLGRYDSVNRDMFVKLARICLVTVFFSLILTEIDGDRQPLG